MIRIDGPYLSSTLTALQLPPDEQQAARDNARSIIEKVAQAYDSQIGPGQVGASGTGIPAGFAPSAKSDALTGLVYGRIQSGKTRAMIASTALAFDNGFRVVIVLTSNINDLVEQTLFDFASGLPNVMVFTKDNELEAEIQNAKLDLESNDGRLLIICSKGSSSLKNVIAFLKNVNAQNYPAIIFDDEGDQASLDTKIRERSTSNVAVAPSTINKLIQKDLRPLLRCHIYVSVTGTPQAVLLQSAGSGSKPSFIELLEPGPSYVGGSKFFATDEPEDNSEALIEIVDPDEKAKLLNQSAPVPPGLRRAILFFLLSASAAIRRNGLPSHKKGYSFLAHPSLKNDEQGKAAKRITDFLNVVKATLLKVTGSDPKISAELAQGYANLKKTLGSQTPTLNELSQTILEQLKTRRILVINAKAKRRGIEYGNGLNFLIGGNTLGRGIAIRDLLVTYYLRDSRVSQIDTMHQHARMFGYRSGTLAFTRLFIPRRLYYRFRDIHRSDESLRDYILKYKDNPQTFPIDTNLNLRATRPSVLNVNTTATAGPGEQIYPDRVIVPQRPAQYSKVLKALSGYFGSAGPSMEKKGKDGVQISAEEAMALTKLVKTKSENTWRDATIGAVIRKVADKFGGKITLRFRKADRSVREDGFLSTGTLSGPELDAGKEAKTPTLWIMQVTTTDKSFCGAGKTFFYPTLVIPSTLPALLMFNKG